MRRLSLLSGGERSLVAMAYLFAVFRSRPSPFYLMDEVEAALDDVNLMRFLALVNEFREEAQLIIVSHQKRTMEAADALYGVTMAPGGSSKVVSQKVPRDRTAVDTLGARPTTKLDVSAVAPVGVPELADTVDPTPTRRRRDAVVESDADPADELDRSSGTDPVPDADADPADDRPPAAADHSGATDGTSGDDSLTLADLLEQPPRREGPGIPVPPPRVDVGGTDSAPDAER